MPTAMRYIDAPQPGDAGVLVLADGPAPSPAPGEVLIRVQAAGVNRPDVLQREGKYAPPLTGVEPLHIWEAMRTGPQQMPVFGEGAIPDEDVAKIIGYLKSLEEQPNAGFTLGGLGPVTEGLFGWIIGIGSLCLLAVWITTHGARAK